MKRIRKKHNKKIIIFNQVELKLGADKFIIG